MRKPRSPDNVTVDRTPSVWFLRLELAIKRKDVEVALTAQRRLSELGFDVRVIREAVAS